MRLLLATLCCLHFCGPLLADREVEKLNEALYLEVVSGEPERALSRYRKLVKASTAPSLKARAQLGIGRCLQKLNRHNESLKALHAVLHDHPGQVRVVQLALEMIRAYKSEAEQAIQSARDLKRLRDEKIQLEAKLKQAEAKGQSVLRKLRKQLVSLQSSLRKLERDGAARPQGASQLLKELASREAVRRQTASDLADQFLDSALGERRNGRYRQALRLSLLARHYAPEDTRVANLIATIRTLLGENETPNVEQLRIEAAEIRSRIERLMTHYRGQLDQIWGSGRPPLEQLGALRRVMREMPASLLASPLANQTRSRIISLMTGLAAQPRESGVPIPDQSGDRLAWYTLPRWVEPRTVQVGGIQAITLDRQLRPIKTTPFVPPGPEERRRDLHRALSQLVSLDDPRAASFGLPASGRLLVIARPELHRTLQTVLSRIRHGQSQLYEIRLRLVQFATGTAVPWARWAVNPVAAGDGSYLILDAMGQQSLLKQLSESGSWQYNTIGPLRLWAGQQGVMEVTGKSVFLVGYRQRLIQGRMQSQPQIRTMSEGLELKLRTLATRTGIRLEMDLDGTRLARPVHSLSTRDGRIQVPSRASQSMQLDVEVPRNGALVMFGLTNPIKLTRGLPGRLAVIVEPRVLAGTALPPGHLVRHFSLGSLATLKDDPIPDLGSAESQAGLSSTVERWLQGKDRSLSLSFTGSGVTASGTPKSLTAFKRRLGNLRRLANRTANWTIRGWHVSPKTLPPIAKLIGKPLVNDEGRLVTVVLPAKLGDRAAKAIDTSKEARRLALPTGPYPTRGVARLVASRITLTRYLRDPGGGSSRSRFANVGEGIALAIRLLPNEIMHTHFMIARLKEMVPTKRAHGTGFEPRRQLVSGSISPVVPSDTWVLVTGITDPGQPKRTVLLLIKRGK